MQEKNLIEKKEENNQEIEKKGGIFSQIDLDTKREIAKIGMTASMGITVATSFYMKNKFMKNLHIGAGVALVGFSFWHHMLYQPDKKDGKQKMPKGKKEEPKEEVVLKDETKPSITDNLAISFNNFYIELAITGKFTHNEFKLLEQKIESILEVYDVPSINILIDIRDIEGIELKALWDDCLFALKHIKQLKKAAVVGNKKLEEYAISLANKLLSTELSYFEDYEKAHKWLIS